MTNIEILNSRIARERKSRKEAEQILEQKSLALFDANQKLLNLASELERKIIERTKALEIAKQQAEKAQKAEQNFLSNMSHEIRTPLNAIIGMAHLLMGTQLSDEQKNFVDVLNSSSTILQKLITDILDFSKIDAGKIEVNNASFRLKDLAENVYKTFREKVKLKENKLSLKFDKKINNQLIGDELLISQILINLIGNAEKFTKNGKIELQFKLEEETKKYQTVSIKITDTGIGMTKNEVSRIFKLFEQANKNTTKQFGGTGLGLHISQRIAKLLSSKIKVKSKKGKGSQFYFKIKFKKSLEKSKKSKKAQLELSFDRNAVRILVVEDNAANQKYISTILNKWEVNYDLAESGEVAIEKCKDNRYQLILMDIQMPGISGFETTKEIKQMDKFHDTAIIAFSASGTLTIKQMAIECGMIDFIPKPFTPIQLKEKLALYLNSKETKSELDSKQENKEEPLNMKKRQKEFKGLLEDTYLNDYEFAQEIFNDYLIEMDKKVDELRILIAAKQYTEFKNLAHNISPSFDMVGLPKLGKKLKKLSHYQDKDSETLLTQFKKFTRDFDESKPIVKYYFSILKDKVKQTKVSVNG